MMPTYMFISFVYLMRRGFITTNLVLAAPELTSQILLHKLYLMAG